MRNKTPSSRSHLPLSVTGMEADAPQSHAGLKINSYSAEYKLEAMKVVEEGSSIHRAARKFNVDRIREFQNGNEQKLTWKLQIISENVSKEEKENYLMKKRTRCF